MIPDDEPFRYQEPAKPVPHTDECIKWLEQHEPRPIGIEW